MAVPLVLLLCLGAFYSTASADHDLHSEYAHHVVLDPTEKMNLYWTVDWDAKTVSFAVEAETTGWVEFGFSNGSGQMIGSDVVIGWVKDNKGYLQVNVYLVSRSNSFALNFVVSPLHFNNVHVRRLGASTVKSFTSKQAICK